METAIYGRSWAVDRDWEAHKDLIEHLYCKLHKPLREVAAILSKDHGFHATDKMYKNKFKKWGFRKNLSAAESLHVQRQMYMGTASLPIVHGRPLGSKRLKALVWSGQRTVEMRNRSTTQTIPRYIRPPDDISLPESALYEVSRYSQTYLETHRWDFSTANNLTSDTAAWGIQLAETAMHIRDRNHALGFRLLNDCCAQFQSILEKQQSLLVWAILVAVIELDAASEQVASTFIRFVTSMCSIKLGSQHPLTKLCCDMLSIIQLSGLDRAKLSARSILMSQLDLFHGETGHNNIFVTLTNVIMLQWLNDCGVVSDESCLEDSEVIFLRTHEKVAEPEFYHKQIWIGLLLAGWLMWKNQHHKAVKVLRLVEESNQMGDLILHDRSMILPEFMRRKVCVGERLVMAVTEKIHQKPVVNIRYMPGYGVLRWLGHADSPFRALCEIE